MDRSDAAMVALTRAGDGDAFRVLVERHSLKLFHLAFRLTGNEQDAEDIVQEAFLRAYRNLDRFDERAQFTTWLYRIATNAALDALRSRGQKAETSLSEPNGEAASMAERLPASTPDPERLLNSEQTARQLQQALDSLSVQERAAFSLRHFEGLSTSEIAEVLQVNAGAAKHAVFRAVKKMRAALQSGRRIPAWKS